MQKSDKYNIRCTLAVELLRSWALQVIYTYSIQLNLPRRNLWQDHDNLKLPVCETGVNILLQVTWLKSLFEMSTQN